METITLPVEGMTCGGCVRSVETALARQPGVSTAKASLQNKRVTVQFDAATVGRAQLEQAIRKAGYEVPA